MPELELGIGRVRGELGGVEREWLAWHDGVGNPYPLPAEVIQCERQRANQERQRADEAQLRADQAELEKVQLLDRLRQLGIDLDQL
jgi:hypothetical protein